MTGTFLVAALLGLLTGLVMGGLGAGGSILSVPALVYLLGQDPHTATTVSLIVVGVTALVGAAVHSREGRVRWVRGVVFGLLGAAGSLIGSVVALRLDPQMLMLAFAGLMLTVAAALTRPERSVVPAPSPRARLVRILLAATGIGILTGIFGVGGGFVVVPALVFVLGMDMKTAVGTSLVVIAVNSGIALAARLGGSAVVLDWALVIPFALFALLGAVGSTRLVDILPARVVRVAFSALLVLVAVGMGTSALAEIVRT